jgi:hypothetical protein
MCFGCYVRAYPNEPRARHYKVKELAVMDRLVPRLKELSLEVIFLNWRLDKRVDNGCSRRRPDILIECGAHTVIVEVDENQHRGYTCEEVRMNDLFADLGCQPCALIRFNPDKYVDALGKKHPGCFAFHKVTGATLLQKDAFDTRIAVLLDKVADAVRVPPAGEGVTVTELFYDA